MKDGADLLEQSGLVTDALRTLASRHRRTRAQLAVLAHSMGGVAALHALGGTGGPTRTHTHMPVAVAAVIGLGAPFRAPPLRASRALDAVYTDAIDRGADRGAGWLREAAAENAGGGGGWGGGSGGGGGEGDAMPAWVSICGGEVDWMVAAPAGLQPYVPRSATLYAPLCSPTHPTLQPYVGGASAVPPRGRRTRCRACTLRDVD